MTMKDPLAEWLQRKLDKIKRNYMRDHMNYPALNELLALMESCPEDKWPLPRNGGAGTLCIPDTVVNEDQRAMLNLFVAYMPNWPVNAGKAHTVEHIKLLIAASP